MRALDVSLTNLWRTWRVFRAGKRPSRAILAFEAELEHNLIKLCVDLHNGTYRHGGYSHKILNEKKRRDILVADIRDRVVHRLLYDYLVAAIDKRLDPDVWSGRKEKGLHRAISRTLQLADNYSQCYVWRADIAKFFDSVDHTGLKKLLRFHIDDQAANKLLDKVIDSYIHNGKPAREFPLATSPARFLPIYT